MAWTNMAVRSNGYVVDSGDWNQMVANFAHIGGTLGDTKTGNYSITGTLYVATAPLTIGPSAAASGIVRIANAQTIMWRNAGGSGDVGIQVDAADRLVFAGAGGSWNTSTSVGAAGGASALPATPLGYLVSVVNGNSCRFPFYA